ncbi:MAG: hypothetical protein JSV58_03775 [Candidatus Bathyarchaeota archaeon]|nr:MAG: hypothetical protein JSV58_03775 [Candidatus Bathyarchaeota archaeon]
MREYVSRIEEACGEGRDFIVILKHAKREEAIKKILAKCEIDRSFSRIMMKGKYKDKAISIFVTGKLILKGMNGRRAAEETLEELLT